MNRKRINNINEIYDGKKLLIKEFIDLDLSNIDLSIIPMKEWEDCIFYNSSFKNTGIKFIPNKLKKGEEYSEFLTYHVNCDMDKRTIVMNFCDFSDNDLSYLTKEDFCICGEVEVSTYGCDLTNTKINFLRTLVNVKLDLSYQEHDYNSKYWSFEYGTVNWPDFIDINTIIKNPHLKVPSFRVMNAIYKYVKKDALDNDFFKHLSIGYYGELICKKDELNIVYNYMEKIVTKCEDMLEYDTQGYGKKLYYKLLPFMTLENRYAFFMFEIMKLNISNINFEDIPCELLRYYTIRKNQFENVIFNNSLSDLLKLWGGSEFFLDTIPGYENKYHNVSFPNIKYDSWQENPHARKRISESSFTFFTKLYLELSRTCNANCAFCRNKSFDKCKYDLQNIINTLYMVKNYVNAVVIGGGEPTLRLDDVKYLRESLHNDEIDWHMFTNGTNPLVIYDEYIMNNFKINLSRHTISDEENAKIFKVNKQNIMSTKDVERLNQINKEVTLNATCFIGGLDTKEKIIEYIDYAKSIGCKKVLIQNLQTESSLGKKILMYDNLSISENIFKEVIEYLRSNGYKQKNPIYATGGYVSYVFKDKNGFTISIQNYISCEKLEKEWPTALKKAFDLSIDPTGKLYENWHQKTGLVKTLKK